MEIVDQHYSIIGLVQHFLPANDLLDTEIQLGQRLNAAFTWKPEIPQA